MKITVASGKGGTGKTLLATNLALAFKKIKREVTFLDCDVETPNGHLFLKPRPENEELVSIRAPLAVDSDRCTACGRCAEVCNYNALAVVRNRVLFFRELCHACGGCVLACPEDAIREGERAIGIVKTGLRRGIRSHYGLLNTGEGGMTPRIIKKVKEKAGPDINILDAPPGTACPAVETVKDSDLCILVTDPTPFGLHDLKLAVAMCRALALAPVVVVNRVEGDYASLRTYCREMNLEIIGEIPDDRSVAEVYSRGGLVFKEMPHYKQLFLRLAQRILAFKIQPLKAMEEKEQIASEPKGRPSVVNDKSNSVAVNELVVISGKGGTGKTSLVAAFLSLEGNAVVADCDVDASDLHLVLSPEIISKGQFSGGYLAAIDPEKCTGCGHCKEVCRFEAIAADNHIYTINSLACEGCGVCRLVCDAKAINLKEAVNGEWYTSRIRYGHMAHARLGIAEENSGRLVTFTREQGISLAAENDYREMLIDGSPGTGCPVIASLTGARYALVVTEPTVSGLHDLERILDLVNFFAIPAGVVVNKGDINPGMTAAIEKRAYELKTEFLGSIPYDKAFTYAQMEQKTIIEFAPENKTAGKVQEIWQLLKQRLI